MLSYTGGHWGPTLLSAHSYSSFRKPPPTFPSSIEPSLTQQEDLVPHTASSASCGDGDPWFSITWPTPPLGFSKSGVVIYSPWGSYSPNDAFRLCLINICWINELSWMRWRENLVAPHSLQISSCCLSSGDFSLPLHLFCLFVFLIVL